jgi:dTDP-4-amino-4,6-dideoxy-D-galactose acyltransferase
MAAAICEYLEWDSEFFGFRIARMTENRLDTDRLAQARAWCATHAIDCLYFLANSDDPQTSNSIRQSGFQPVDIRVTLEQSLAPRTAVPTPAIRTFQPSDLPLLCQIARASHHDSRFYYDPRFPRSRCDLLYEAWIERSVNGWADTVLVAAFGGLPAGYLSCHLADSGVGSIGLVAVSGEHRGKGLGRQLIDAALDYFQTRGMKRVTVVTQGRNIASQRLYQRCGFLTQSVQLWYHYWFRDSPG